MYILGIESSCDETAVAVLSAPPAGGTAHLLASLVSTQIPLHRLYGGVIPELASRNHSGRLPMLLHDALDRSGLTVHEIDTFVATGGPGLAAALLVGHSAAKALALAAHRHFISINHIEGHLLSPFLGYPPGDDDSPLPPAHIGLVVSGGHSLLLRVNALGSYELLGRSCDDAAGEAFDKIARMLGLPYPGGPEIDKLAERGSATRFRLPRPMLLDSGYNFSFSGLKTAVLRILPTIAAGGNPHLADEQSLCDICAGVQTAVVDVLVHKARLALRASGLRLLAVSGGVSCNRALRSALAKMCLKEGYELLLPRPEFTTDNAAMIAFTGLLRARSGLFSPLTAPVDPNLQLAGFATRP